MKRSDLDDSRGMYVTVPSLPSLKTVVSILGWTFAVWGGVLVLSFLLGMLAYGLGWDPPSVWRLNVLPFATVLIGLVFILISMLLAGARAGLDK